MKWRTSSSAWPVVGLAALIASMVVASGGQQVSVPCPFNSMCSCKMMRSVTLSTVAAASVDDSANQTAPPSSSASSTTSNDDYDAAEEEQDPDDSADAVGDVSCVGVPFASIPGIPFAANSAAILELSVPHHPTSTCH